MNDAFATREKSKREPGTCQGRAGERAVRCQEDVLLADLVKCYSTAPVGTCLLDSELRYVHVNEFLADVNGRPVSEHVGRTLHEMIPGIAPLIEPTYRQVLASGNPVVGREVRTAAPREAGVELDWLVSFYPVCAENGEVVGVSTFVQDITDRKRAERALEHALDDLERRVDERTKELQVSEERFRSIFESSAAGMVVADVEGRFLQANPAFCRFLGYEESELLLLRVADVTHPDDLSPTAGIFLDAQSASASEAYNLEKRYLRSDGATVWGRVTATWMKHAGSERQYCVALVQDVTERKQAEESLRLTQFAIDRSMDAAFWMGDDFRFLYVNEAACRSLGYSREELLSMSVPDIGPEFPPERIAELWKETQSRGSFSFESLHRRKDGSVFPVEITVNHLEYAGKESNFAFARDISARKQAENALQEAQQQLHQSQKMDAIGKLAGGVAHDFNNLLTVINGYTSMLLAGAAAHDPARASLEEIARAGGQAAKLTQQLLSFSRRQFFEPQAIDLNQAVAETGELLHRLIGENVELKVSTASAPLHVLTDPGQIEQIVINLAVNARDAMSPEGGTLTVATARQRLGEEHVPGRLKPGEYAVLSVCDTGEGIDPAIQDRIFEPFFTTKEVGKGTGLGLSTVYGITRRCNGHVEVSSAVGHGTTFTVYLPCGEKRPLDDASAESPSQLPGGTETLLLVEDEPAVRRLSEQVLAEQGYKVLTASAGEDALQVVAHHADPIDLLVTDVRMPKMTGPKLATLLRAERPHLKVLYVSGYAIDDGGSAESSSFLAKPFTPSGLVRKVREVLDEST